MIRRPPRSTLFPYTTLFRSLPGLQYFLDFVLQRAVQLTDVLGILEEPACADPFQELRPRLKVIIHAGPLIGTRRPRRRRHREAESIRILFAHRPRDGRLAAARRRGQDDDPRPCRHSKFSSCSRNFSRSPFIAITVWVIRASLALEPIVFTSRNNSCARNPSCLPTG